MNRLLIALLVLAAAAQAIVTPLLNLAGLGVDIGARSQPYTTPATPIGWAFAIWGLIFLWTFVYAVFQAAPGRRDDGLVRTTRLPALFAFLCNTAWAAWVQFNGVDGVSLVVILAGLAANLTVMARLARAPAPLSWTDRLLVKAPLGLLAGWITVAAAANAAAVAMRYGLHPMNLATADQAAILIGAAGALAALVALGSRANLGFAAAAAWGLATVIARNQGPDGDGTTAMVAGAGILAVVIGLIVGASRKSSLRAPPTG